MADRSSTLVLRFSLFLSVLLTMIVVFSSWLKMNVYFGRVVSGRMPAAIVRVSSAEVATNPAGPNAFDVSYRSVREGLSPTPLDSLNPTKVVFQQVTTGLTSPVFIAHAGDGSGRIFIVEQSGIIRILKNGALLATPFLDIHTLVRSGGEQGMMALAFNPSYSANREFYVVYTAPRPGDSTGSILTLERFLASSDNVDHADLNSGFTILTVDHPTKSNHNGGTLAFGNDGYLYWSIGDGGGTGDPPNNAQNQDILLGKILRIDVNHTDPGLNYSIPTDNPFYGISGKRGEIWAYGLRNPFRLSFDRLTADLYIGDVGQALREEIDFQPAAGTGGENYGWRVMEGTTCYNTADPNTPLSNCDGTGKVLPITQYDHSLGCAVTGGYVYRGSNFPSLFGHYFYGDYCSGRVFDLYNTGSTWISTQLADTPYFISSFGEDDQGELYFANYSGAIYQVRYNEATHPLTDFDGDGRTDPAKFYFTTGTAFVSWLSSITNTWNTVYMDNGTFNYVPRSDFDGDGRSDPAKLVSSIGALSYLQSSTGTWDSRYLGSDTYNYVDASDFDGDGRTDPAKFVPSIGALWYLKSSNGAWEGKYLGSDVSEYVAGSDLDGDGKTDPAKLLANGALWYFKSSTGTWDGKYLGSDVTTYVDASDYDGDGITDPAKLVSPGVLWYLKSSTGTWEGKFIGSDSYIYVSGSDFDGDGKTDPAKFYPGTGILWWLNSQTGTWQGVFMGSDSYDVVN